MTRVSIGLPVYNGQQFLRKSIDSILAQSFREFELVISDNGSNDDTQNICEEYTAKDDRVRYLRYNTNRGAAWNYNNAFDKCDSKYFKWASHDDVCEPDFIAKCVAVLDEHTDTVLAYPRTRIIDENGTRLGIYDDNLNAVEPTPSGRLKHFIFRGAGECNAVFGLIRRSALARTDRIGNFKGSDTTLLAHLVLLGKFREIPEALFLRRDHPQTSGRASANDSDFAAWFDPNKRENITLPNCRWSVEYFKCIFRSRLPKRELLSCLKLAAKKTWWSKTNCGLEIARALIRLTMRLLSRIRDRVRNN